MQRQVIADSKKKIVNSMFLPLEKRLEILELVITHGDIKEIMKLSGVGRGTIIGLIKHIGRGCFKYHNANLYTIKSDMPGIKAYNAKIHMMLDTESYMMMSWMIADKLDNYAVEKMLDAVGEERQYKRYRLDSSPLDHWTLRSLQNQLWAYCIYFTHYNFCEDNPTPAMNANIADKPYSLEWLLNLGHESYWEDYGKLLELPKKEYTHCPRCKRELRVLNEVGAIVKNCLDCGFEYYEPIKVDKTNKGLLYIGRYSGDYNNGQYNDITCTYDATNKKMLSCPYCLSEMEQVNVNSWKYRRDVKVTKHQCKYGHEIYFSIGEDRAVWW